MAHTLANTFIASSGAGARSTKRAGASLAALLMTVVDGLVAWQDRANGRRELAALDDRLLKDIGVSRVDALREADKPFWRT